MKLQFYFQLQKGNKKNVWGNAWLSLFLKHCDGEFGGGGEEREGKNRKKRSGKAGSDMKQILHHL